MKRLLLSLVCCFPLFFSPSTSFSLDLAKPGSERIVSYEQYGPIAGNETLWRIATKLRPNRSVTVQQTLVAIYKINPFAFYKGNINKIIPESIIKVPTLQFIQTHTNQEAVVLLAKYTAPKQPTALPVPKPPQAPIKETVEPEIPQPENNLAEEKLSALENKLNTLRDELNFVNQQLSLVTAENQGLQLQLQPLSVQLDALKAQLESESVIQERLQRIVAVYQAQLAAVKEPPFSGDGVFYAVLRFLTSSITHLLLAIMAPVLLVLAVLLVVMRKNSKASAHKEEQAESQIRLTSKSVAQNTAQEEVRDAPLSDSEAASVGNVSLDKSSGSLATEPADSDLPAESENLPAAQSDATTEDDLSPSTSPEEEDSKAQASQEQVHPELEASSPAETLLANVCIDKSPSPLITEPADCDLPAESESLSAAQSDATTEDDFSSNASSEELNYTIYASQELDLSELEATDIDTIDLSALQLPEVSAQHDDQSEIHHLDENEQFDAALLEQFYQAESEQADHDALQSSVKQSTKADPAPSNVSEVDQNNFIAIEKLLQKSESQSKEEPYSELVVDLGLDEFPDVINAQYGLEDDENGLSTQLDLARAYLEIGDKAGAQKILLSVVEDSDGAQRSEIEKLLSRLA